MKHRIAIVDDHVLIAKALSSIIEKMGDYTVLFEAENGQQLMERMGEEVPDLVLLDVNMPVMDGFQTAAWLKANHPQVRVLALSVQEEDETLIKIMRAGAQGYLLKNVRPVELRQALDAMMEKGYFYPEWVAYSMIRSITQEESTPQANEREREFLQHAASDLTYKEIADRMNCSPRTVETYRDNLCERFGVKSRVSLVVFAIKQGLIEA